MVRLGEGEVGGGGAEDGLAMAQMSPARLYDVVNDILVSDGL